MYWWESLKETYYCGSSGNRIAVKRKLNKPQCFTNVKYLIVGYKANKTARMTWDFFKRLQNTDMYIHTYIFVSYQFCPPLLDIYVVDKLY